MKRERKECREEEWGGEVEGNLFVINQRMLVRKRRKPESQFSFILGILSRATAPHHYTLLHVCSAPAGVCWCFIGCFLFHSGSRVLSGLQGSGPVGVLEVVKHCHCHSAQHH